MRLLAITSMVLTAALSSVPAVAQDIAKGDIKITEPWTRATPGGAKVGAGYLTVTNTGKASDRLVGGAVSGARSIEIHDTTLTDGVMRMRRLESGVEIKPGETVTLKPGGMHMMFIDLDAPLKQGGRIKGTLTFEKAGAIDVEFSVAAIGAASPSQTGAPPASKSHHHH